MTPEQDPKALAVVAETMKPEVKTKAPQPKPKAEDGRTQRLRAAYVRSIRRKAERHLDDYDNALLWDQAYTAIPTARIIY